MFTNMMHLLIFVHLRLTERFATRLQNIMTRWRPRMQKHPRNRWRVLLGQGFRKRRVG